MSINTKQAEEYYRYTHKIVRETLLAACIDPHLTSSAKAVLACLFAHAYTRHPADVHDDGYLVDESGKRIGCFPSQETIASEAQISETAVSLALKLLRKHGYVRFRKIGKSNDYLLEITKGKSPQQIRAEGKARQQTTTEKPKKKGRRHSDETRTKMSASHKRRRSERRSANATNSHGLTSVYPTNSNGLTSVYTNVEKLINEEKNSNVDASRSPSSSTLDETTSSVSPDNEVDLSSRDKSIDVRSSLDASEAPISPDNEDAGMIRRLEIAQNQQRIYEEERAVLLLTDEELGVTSSPDYDEKAWFAERKARISMRKAEVRQKYASLIRY